VLQRRRSIARYCGANGQFHDGLLSVSLAVSLPASHWGCYRRQRSAAATLRHQETGQERNDTSHGLGILLVPLFLCRRTIIDEDKHFGQHPCPPAEIRAVE